MEKILATVIQTTIAFTAHYPFSKVLFSGSTVSRTRLYNILLTKEFDNLSDFVIEGIKNSSVFPFERNQIYEGFVIYKKLL